MGRATWAKKSVLEAVTGGQVSPQRRTQRCSGILANMHQLGVSFTPEPKGAVAGKNKAKTTAGIISCQ